MKILRAVSYVLGIFLTLLNVASVLNIDSNRIPSDTPGRIGYFLAMVFFFIPGIVCILIAKRISKKIRRRKEKQLVDSLAGPQDHKPF